MAQPEIPEVPPNQKIEKDHATHFNETFARKAETCASRLHEWADLPLSVITFETDSEAFFKCRAVQQYSVSQLSLVSYGRGDQLILDFWSHRVEYFSFHLGVNGVNIDAPARLRLTFGEVTYDVTEDLHPCMPWISTSWLPDETIDVDWAPAEVNMARRYSFRYVKIEILDTSPKYKVQSSDVKVRAVSVMSPETASEVEPLQTSDEELISLDRICMLTLRFCMQTVFENGPRRDRRLWL